MEKTKKHHLQSLPLNPETRSECLALSDSADVHIFYHMLGSGSSDIDLDPASCSWSFWELTNDGLSTWVAVTPKGNPDVAPSS